MYSIWIAGRSPDKKIAAIPTVKDYINKKKIKKIIKYFKNAILISFNIMSFKRCLFTCNKNNLNPGALYKHLKKIGKI